jgi:hypothetical protein
MKKLIALPVVTASVLSLTVACYDHPVEPPGAAAPPRPLFGESTPFNNAGQCLGNDVITWHDLVGTTLMSPDDLGCIASDVDVAAIVATEMLVGGSWIPIGANPITCTEGQAITLRMSASLQSALQRLDVGLWLGTDGGNAKSGSCNHYNLPVNPLSSGASNTDGDSCGDMNAGAATSIDLGEVTLTCHANASGKLEVPTCVAWSLAANERVCPVDTIPGPNGFRAGTLPGGIARCRCEAVEVATISAPTTGSITIIEDTNPNDSQDFSFTSTGSGLPGFSLDDDTDGTLQNTRTFPNLDPNTYTVAEGGSPGFDLTSLVCSSGGAADLPTRTATITLAAGANVTCTFVNAKRVQVLVNKRENGALPLSSAYQFEVRTGASTTSAGTVVANGAANLASGTVSFGCVPNPNASCENVGGSARLVPGAYQLCEVTIPQSFTNNLVGFTPGGSTPEGTTNGAECVGISLAAGATGVPTGVPDPINDVPPPASGGSITLGTGSFTLVNDALSGSFLIRNSSMGTQQVYVTTMTVVDATFRDGATLVQATVTGCAFAPLPVLIPANGSQSISLTGCQVTPSARKELMFTVRATLNGGDQPFYERVYKVRVQ